MEAVPPVLAMVTVHPGRVPELPARVPELGPPGQVPEPLERAAELPARVTRPAERLPAVGPTRPASLPPPYPPDR